MNFMRPYWTPARSVGRILLRLGTLLLWVTLLTADSWVAANGGSTTTSVPSLEQIVEAVNISCRIALIVASIGSAIGIVREILLIRSRRRAARPVMKVGQSEPMDLLERYLQAVRLFVPRRQYDDIVAEVSTNLVTRMDDSIRSLAAHCAMKNGSTSSAGTVIPSWWRDNTGGHERLIGPTLFPVYLNAIAGLGITLLLSLMLGLFTQVPCPTAPGFARPPRCVPSSWAHGVCVHDTRVRSRRTLAIASTIGCACLTRACGSASHSACTAASRPAGVYRCDWRSAGNRRRLSAAISTTQYD